ncbi:hypothetical protein F4803DRAFT_268672 [Xylaria telfairii]|nr:hypothetical protein F4803DRAFT_268672 [Xylaria telfairii]
MSNCTQSGAAQFKSIEAHIRRAGSRDRRCFCHLRFSALRFPFNRAQERQLKMPSVETPALPESPIHRYLFIACHHCDISVSSSCILYYHTLYTSTPRHAPCSHIAWVPAPPLYLVLLSCFIYYFPCPPSILIIFSFDTRSSGRSPSPTPKFQQRL